MRNTVQLTLFAELVERQVMRDRVADEGVFLNPPPGRGWRVADSHRERHTAWVRRRQIVLPRRWRRQ
jgi:hypothetical protein